MISSPNTGQCSVPKPPSFPCANLENNRKLCGWLEIVQQQEIGLKDLTDDQERDRRDQGRSAAPDFFWSLKRQFIQESLGLRDQPSVFWNGLVWPNFLGLQVIPSTGSFRQKKENEDSAMKTHLVAACQLSTKNFENQTSHLILLRRQSNLTQKSHKPKAAYTEPASKWVIVILLTERAPKRSNAQHCKIGSKVTEWISLLWIA